MSIHYLESSSNFSQDILNWNRRVVKTHGAGCHNAIKSTINFSEYLNFNLYLSFMFLSLYLQKLSEHKRNRAKHELGKMIPQLLSPSVFNKISLPVHRLYELTEDSQRDPLLSQLYISLYT